MQEFHMVPDYLVEFIVHVSFVYFLSPTSWKSFKNQSPPLWEEAVRSSLQHRQNTRSSLIETRVALLQKSGETFLYMSHCKAHEEFKEP